LFYGSHELALGVYLRLQACARLLTWLRRVKVLDKYGSDWPPLLYLARLTPCSDLPCDRHPRALNSRLLILPSTVILSLSEESPDYLRLIRSLSDFPLRVTGVACHCRPTLRLSFPTPIGNPWPPMPLNTLHALISNPPLYLDSQSSWE